MSLPGVGVKGADKILEMREAKEDLELEDLSHVPYLRLTSQLIRGNINTLFFFIFFLITDQICTLGRFCIFYKLFPLFNQNGKFPTDCQ
jgi:hypothetical protein